jgi:hypothetical protein
MKYGLARFVYGLAGVLLVAGGAALFFTPQSENPPTTKNTDPNILASAAIAGVPVALGVLCLFRCWHWSRKAGGKE